MATYNQTWSIPIHLIKEWCFCPRVFYYQEILSLHVHQPIWLSQGATGHKHIEKLEKRRSFKQYGLEQASRDFNVELSSNTLQLHGVVDWILETTNAVYVVEYKTNTNPSNLGHKLQLTAYALLAAERYHKPCRIGFLVSDNNSHEIVITKGLVKQIQEITYQMRQVADTGLKPSSSACHVQCSQCQYVNFCNDR